MSRFEFVAVIISMVLALALGQLLLGVAALAKSRARLTAYLPHSLWLVTFFFMILAVWWAMWDFRDLEWTYPSFFFVTLAPTLLFFAVALQIPAGLGERHVSLEAHFLSVRLLFMTVMFAYGLATWLDGPLLQGQSLLGTIGALHLVLFSSLTIGLVTENSRAQIHRVSVRQRVF